MLISLCYYIISVYVQCVHHQGDRSERQVCQAGPCTTREIIIGLVILYTDVEVAILNIAVQVVFVEIVTIKIVVIILPLNDICARTSRGYAILMKSQITISATHVLTIMSSIFVIIDVPYIEK